MTDIDYAALRTFLDEINDLNLGAGLMLGNFGLKFDQGFDPQEVLKEIALALDRAATDLAGYLQAYPPTTWEIATGGAAVVRIFNRDRVQAAADLGREARVACRDGDDDSPLTFEARFNNGNGGASITIAGRTRFVEGAKARELAEALDPRKRSGPTEEDIIRAAAR